MNIPKEPDVARMGIRCWDQPDDISLAQLIGPQLGRYDSEYNNHDNHLPQKDVRQQQ